MSPETPTRPLTGTLILDASRMLPGAVLARMLIELGGRLIKIEEPVSGDPLRAAPPFVDGTGSGFDEFYRGAESLCLDLRDARDAACLRKLARSAGVLVESFRPGSMEAWGVGPERLMAANPSLVLCMLSGFGTRGANAARVGHDLNFVALCGLLGYLPGAGVPRVQIADITAGVLAGSAILAALLVRERTGRGSVVDQPLASGPLPFLAWPMADLAAGGGGLTDPDALLTGGCPAYRLYTCADGLLLALGALEPKFWVDFVAMLELHGLEGSGLDTGADGRASARQVQERIATQPRQHWLELADKLGLPVTAVNELKDAARDPALAEAGLLEGETCGPFLPSLGARPTAPAPVLGQHTATLVSEFGLEPA
jgi:crotonobetainyl-CoA:carnitine CoA-transferase CaiB-like acyl-CoA transferase